MDDSESQFPAQVRRSKTKFADISTKPSTVIVQIRAQRSPWCLWEIAGTEIAQPRESEKLILNVSILLGAAGVTPWFADVSTNPRPIWAQLGSFRPTQCPWKTARACISLSRDSEKQFFLNLLGSKSANGLQFFTMGEYTGNFSIRIVLSVLLDYSVTQYLRFLKQQIWIWTSRSLFGIQRTIRLGSHFTTSKFRFHKLVS